jgi:hypothetical protein
MKRSRPFIHSFAHTVSQKEWQLSNPNGEIAEPNDQLPKEQHTATGEERQEAEGDIWDNSTRSPLGIHPDLRDISFGPLGSEAQYGFFSFSFFPGSPLAAEISHRHYVRLRHARRATRKTHGSVADLSAISATTKAPMRKRMRVLVVRGIKGSGHT